ncbi:MAG: DNA mismatch repair protein MutS, partial [Chloroflexi bacterium]
MPPGTIKEPAGLSTPIRRQYLDLKARQPDAILFFRLGDFYETFDDDAQLVSAELGIALTSKPMGKGLRVPLAGVPVQSIEGHLARLIAAGHRVAIAEQLEEARASKGLVRRGIVRVVSPGTALEPALLESGRNAFCAALDVRQLSGRGSNKQGATAALALADLSTGELRGCELAGEDIAAARAAALAELERLGARELLLPAPGPHAAGPPTAGPPTADPHAADPQAAHAQVAPADAGANGWTLTPRPAARFDPAGGSALLCRRFGVSDVEGLGLAGRPALQAALGALLDYLAEGQGLAPDTEAQQGSPAPTDRLAHLGRPQIYEPGDAMRLDAASVRALDLFPGLDGRARAGARPGSGAAPATSPGSLLKLLDRCRTAAGRRLLRRRLERPLIALEAIEQRQRRVALLHAQPLLRARLREHLAAVPDLERLLGRAATGLAAPAELAALGRGLAAAAALSALLREQAQRPGPATAAVAAPGSDADALLEAMAAELPAAAAAQSAIAQTLADEPESLSEGKGDDAGEVLRPGCDARVDALRLRLRAGRESLAALEARERQRSGVASLKLGYHRSFGYYLELGRSHAGAAPPDWERRQTLASGERYVSPELRTLERELLEARDALVLRERELYAALCRRVAGQAAAVQRLATGVARLDVDAALAEVAAAGGWTRPQLDLSAALEIREGRHPLVEAGLPAGRFVPNDLVLDGAGDQVLVVTGPNMAGKSTYLRQTALIVLLAQIGSFVPAARARLGLVDRVFARVGAQDQIAAGRSTFMVEMLETAAICSAATPRSLLILDEIG